MDNIENQQIKTRAVWPIVTAILIAGWMVGMSVVLAALIYVKAYPATHTTETNSQPRQAEMEFNIPDNAPSIGDKRAPLRFIFFSDFQCPYCHDWHQNILPKLKAEFIDTGRAYMVYQDFPFLGEESFDAAAAGECANLQGKYIEYADTLFSKKPQENAGLYSRENLKVAAREIGLDTKLFNFCLDNNLTMNAVQESSLSGQSLNIQSTPTLVVGNQVISGVGDWEDLKKIIQDQLK